jgi:predicted transposase YdaD
MRESVFYQEIEAQGERRGLERGRQEGEQQGRREEAAALILRQLTRRPGNLPNTLRAQVEQLPLPELETLGEALLDFQTLADLETWLAQF